jgi:DNA-binding transcriptional regulator GbsR (MarR family)
VAYFPGQVDLLTFNLEQVRALASPALGQIFWTLGSSEPMSVREVAEQIGKSAQSVHFHVGKLQQVKLVLPVGERKRRSRIEKLFVRAGVFCTDEGVTASAEYRKYRLKSFQATMREFSREKELVYELGPHMPEIEDFDLYNRMLVRLTREEALEIKKKLEALTREILKRPQKPDAPRTQLVFMMRPRIGQSRIWMKELGLVHNGEEGENGENGED